MKTTLALLFLVVLTGCFHPRRSPSPILYPTPLARYPVDAIYPDPAR